SSERANVVREHRELKMVNRAVVQERVKAVAGAREDLAQSRGRRIAGFLRGHIAWTALKEASERLGGDQAPIEQRRNPAAKTSLSELRDHQRHIGLAARDTPADAHSLR